MKGLALFAFGTLFISVFIWFALSYKMFKLLETRHAKKYSAMGKPSLIMNNSISNSFAFMKFLFKREYLELNDPELSKLAKFMRAFFVLYLVLLSLYFVGFMAAFSSVSFGHAP